MSHMVKATVPANCQYGQVTIDGPVQAASGQVSALIRVNWHLSDVQQRAGLTFGGQLKRQIRQIVPSIGGFTVTFAQGMRKEEAALVACQLRIYWTRWLDEQPAPSSRGSNQRDDKRDTHRRQSPTGRR